MITALLVLPYVITPFYAVINPPSLAIISERLQLKHPVQHWQPLPSMSPWLARSVIVAEDSAFCRHHGIDPEAIKKAVNTALRRGYASHGASTIPMQTAKNLFLWYYPGFIRKPLEVPLALWMDAVLGKRRMMEIYLNVAQTGPSLYGAPAAAQRYFGVSAGAVSPHQAANIAASLPNPAKRPANALGWATARYSGTISARSPHADMSCFYRR